MFEFVSVVIKNLFSKPATRNYPAVKRESFQNIKGHIRIDLPSCIFCGMCSRKCPVGAIEVKRPEKMWAINRFQCIQCNACVEGCPKKCLYMDPEYTSPAGLKTIDSFKMPAEIKKEDREHA